MSCQSASHCHKLVFLQNNVVLKVNICSYMTQALASENRDLILPGKTFIKKMYKENDWTLDQTQVLTQQHLDRI